MRHAVALVAAGAIACLGASGWQAWRLAGLSAERAALQTRREAMEQTLAERLDALTREREQIERDRNELAQLTAERQAIDAALVALGAGDAAGVQTLSEALEAIAAADQPGVWLTRIVIDTPARVLRIEGVARAGMALPALAAEVAAALARPLGGFRVLEAERRKDGRTLAFVMSSARDEAQGSSKR